MSRSGGLSEQRPSVIKSRSKLGTHLSTQCSGDERQSRPCAARSENPRPVVWKNDTLPLDLIRYTRAFGDGPRNFEPWSSDVEPWSSDPPLLTTKPHQREDVSALDRFKVHRCPTRRVFSGTGLELVTKQATFRYLYHSATMAEIY
ncbi:uncharacterized protein TNCV_255841 [Trichonephila clavipes]|nr:uncharacterized protein TNCV_255841 [Trichonephila clavipes]